MVHNSEKQNRSYSRKTSGLRPAYLPYPNLMRDFKLLASKSGFVEVEKQIKKETYLEREQHSYTLAKKGDKYSVFFFNGNEYVKTFEFVDSTSAYDFYKSKLN